MSAIAAVSRCRSRASPSTTAARSCRSRPGPRRSRSSPATSSILIPRDHKAELAAAERLARLELKPVRALPFEVAPAHADCRFMVPPGNPGIYDFLASFDDPSRFIAFSAEALPKLMQEGWQIAFAADYPYRIAEGEAQWWADIGESSGIDWFSFELGIEFEGHRINLVPQLAAMLSPPAARS